MRRRREGFFVTFEGGEKLGKSTQANLLAARLKRKGYETVLTREPGGTDVGRNIRELLLNPNYNLSKATEMLLYAADRAQHYKEVLKPGLRAGKIVISDRFYDSTVVYQGHAQGWSVPLLLRIHTACTGMLLPDLTFVLNGTPMMELSSNTVESRGDDFHQKVRENFLHWAQLNHKRCVVIDANRDAEAIAEEVYSHVMARLAERSS